MAKKDKISVENIKQHTDIAERQKALEKALSGIKKDYGEGAIMRLGQQTALNVETIPTGILSLDIALGVGGLPKGRIVEIYGPESSGKTTIALQVAAEVQKLGGTVAYIDAENAMDPTYADALGVNINDLWLSQPDTGEQGLAIADELIKSSAVDLIVVDSVAALVPKAEIEGEMGDAHVGLQARMMSQALRRISGSTSRSHTLVIFINQIREKIGVMFGNPETTTGGRALKFYASVRLEVRKSAQVKDGNDIVGNETTIKVVKNKVAPPFKSIKTIMTYGKGIEKYADMVRFATESENKIDVIQKSGSWYSYKDERLGQGIVNVVKFLKEHPETARDIESDLRKTIEKPIQESNKESNSKEETK